MKRLLVSLLCFAALQVFANPIAPPPYAVISELYFDTGGKWFLEIAFYGPVDTLWIKTNAGEAYYPALKAYNRDRFVVLTCDSLNNPSLTINKKNDCVKLILEANQTGSYDFQKDSISIGNQAGSVIDSIPPNCSIIRNWWTKTSCLDRSPTLGTSNDEAGATATIYGHFYQLGSVLESYIDKFFYFSDRFIMPGELGEVGFPINKSQNYTAKVWAKRYSIDNLLIYTNPINSVYQMNFIKNDFIVYPGDSIRVDFTMATSLKVPAGKKAFFSNYPNPANDQTSFVFDMPMIKFDRVFIKIFSLEGKLVQTFHPKSSNYEFDCSGMNPGTYICKMEQSGVTVASTKLLIVR